MSRSEGHRDALMGEQLRRQRINRGWTQMRTARETGLSRKLVAESEQGLNISVFKLATLMHGLKMSEITIGGDLQVKLRSAASGDVTIPLDVARQIDDIVAQLVTAAATLRSAAAPEDERGGAALRKRAALLARRFAERIRQAGPDELALLEQALPVGGKKKRATPVRTRKSA